MQEMQVRSLNQEDPLEKEMATLSSVLAWRIPRTEEPGEIESLGSQRVGHNWVTDTFASGCFSALHSKLRFCVVFVQHLNPTHPPLRRPPGHHALTESSCGWDSEPLQVFGLGWSAVGRLVTSCWLRYEPWHLGTVGQIVADVRMRWKIYVCRLLSFLYSSTHASFMTREENHKDRSLSLFGTL